MSDLMSRRAVLGGACACSALALAACAGATDEDTTATGGASTTPAPAESSAAPSTSEAAPAAAGIPLDSVPVGGAIIDESSGSPVVIVRDSETSVRAMSASCTHEGCPVIVDGQQLVCPCHNSMFDFTGAVLAGPAEFPLSAVDASIEGDTIVVG